MACLEGPQNCEDRGHDGSFLLARGRRVRKCVKVSQDSGHKRSDTQKAHSLVPQLALIPSSCPEPAASLSSGMSRTFCPSPLPMWTSSQEGRGFGLRARKKDDSICGSLFFSCRVFVSHVSLGNPLLHRATRSLAGQAFKSLL